MVILSGGPHALYHWPYRNVLYYSIFIRILSCSSLKIPVNELCNLHDFFQMLKQDNKEIYANNISVRIIQQTESIIHQIKANKFM